MSPAAARILILLVLGVVAEVVAAGFLLTGQAGAPESYWRLGVLVLVGLAALTVAAARGFSAALLEHNARPPTDQE